MSEGVNQTNEGGGYPGGDRPSPSEAQGGLVPADRALVDQTPKQLQKDAITEDTVQQLKASLDRRSLGASLTQRLPI